MQLIEKSCNGGTLCERYLCALDFLLHAHRYLQSRFFDFIFIYIKINALHYKEEKNRWFDGRNEWVGEYCSKICDQVDFMVVTQYDRNRLDNADKALANFKDPEMEK